MNGALINHLMGGPIKTVPEVGMAATILMHTERQPTTVVEVKVFKSGSRKGMPREIAVALDNWKVVSGSERDGSAEYEYTSNPGNPKRSFVLSLKGCSQGCWVEKHSGGLGWKLALGRRERYYNPRL